MPDMRETETLQQRSTISLKQAARVSEALHECDKIILVESFEQHASFLAVLLWPAGVCATDVLTAVPLAD